MNIAEKIREMEGKASGMCLKSWGWYNAPPAAQKIFDEALKLRKEHNIWDKPKMNLFTCESINA